MRRPEVMREIVTLREALQVCQSRCRAATRTLHVLKDRMLTMDVSIESASIIFAHINDAQALLEGEVHHV